MISLSAFDLSIAALLLLVCAGLSQGLRLGITQSLLVAAARTVVQLLLIGLVLRIVFAEPRLEWVLPIALIMLLAAAREINARQRQRLAGGWGFAISVVSLSLSSFLLTVITLKVILSVSTWYAPQYAIPILGMLLGNSMNGIAIGLERLTQGAVDQRAVIEARLLLGQSWSEAISDVRKDGIRAGLIPIINAMAGAGIVSLPGMMTGQILAGAPPVEAVKYQILIMFLIAAATISGTIAGVWVTSRRLFDQRDRLRLDRLSEVGGALLGR